MNVYRDNPDRIIRLPEVEELTGLSRTSIHRKMKSGDFPLSIPLTSRSIGWKYKDVIDWCKQIYLQSRR